MRVDGCAEETVRFKVKIRLFLNAHVLSQLLVVLSQQRVRRLGRTLPQQMQKLNGSELCVVLPQILGNDGLELQNVRGEEDRLFGQRLNVGLH